jgi:hypothetical protein
MYHSVLHRVQTGGVDNRASCPVATADTSPAVQWLLLTLLLESSIRVNCILLNCLIQYRDNVYMTSGGRSVGIVRSRTQSLEFFLSE